MERSKAKATTDQKLQRFSSSWPENISMIPKALGKIFSGKFASLYIWRKHSTSEQKGVSGPGHVAVVDGTINPVEVQFGFSVGAAGWRSKIHQSPPLNGSNKSGVKSDWDEFEPSVQLQKRKPNKKSGRAWHCGFRALSSETTVASASVLLNNNVHL